MQKNDFVVRCRYCRQEGPALVSPTKRKRLVLLTCATCGNPVRVQYVPKQRKESRRDENVKHTGDSDPKRQP